MSGVVNLGPPVGIVRRFAAVCRKRWLLVLISASVVLASYGLIFAGRRRDCRDCADRLRFLALALQRYRQDDRTLPPAYAVGKDGKAMHSWRVLLLPCLEGGRLFRQYDLSEPWNGPHNSQLIPISFWEYRCPRDDGVDSRTNYVAVVGKGTLWPGPTGAKVPVDGSARGKVLLIAIAHSDIPWAQPRDITLEEFLDLIESGSAQQLSGASGKPIMGVDAYGALVFINPDEDLEEIRSKFMIGEHEEE